MEQFNDDATVAIYKWTAGFNQVHADKSRRLWHTAEHSEFRSALHWELWWHFLQGTSMFIVC